MTAKFFSGVFHRTAQRVKSFPNGEHHIVIGARHHQVAAGGNDRHPHRIGAHRLMTFLGDRGVAGAQITVKFAQIVQFFLYSLFYRFGTTDTMECYL